jgi:hypothetical protein
MGPSHWQRPFWPWAMPRPRNFVFSLGDEIRRLSPNFVTPYSYIDYSDNVQQRKLMSSLFMCYTKPMTPHMGLKDDYNDI